MKLFKNFFVTVASVLMACLTCEVADFGEGMGFRLHPYISSPLVLIYGKFGSLGNAQWVFYGAPEKRIEIWNSMISAYILVIIMLIKL